MVPLQRFQRQDRRGFSLLELLIVVAVTTILSGMALGAAKTVRKAALGASCTGNLHQVSLGCQAYNTDNEGAMVPNFGNNSNGQGPSYFDFLFPYLEMNSGTTSKQKKNIFVCAGGRPMKTSAEGGWDWMWNYGLNAATHPNFDLNSNWRTIYLAQITKPSQVIDIADGTQPPTDESGNSSRVIAVYNNWASNNGYYDDDGGYAPILASAVPDALSGILRFRHGADGYPGQRCNIAFVDGRVAPVAHRELVKSVAFAASLMP